MEKTKTEEAGRGRGRPNLRGEPPCWNDVTVKSVRRNEVCLGHMARNKTGTVSCKVHKQASLNQGGA